MTPVAYDVSAAFSGAIDPWSVNFPTLCEREDVFARPEDTVARQKDTAARQKDTVARPDDVRQIFRELSHLDVLSMNTEGVRRALVRLACVQAWVDAQKIQLARRLAELAEASQSVHPEHVLAVASGTTRGDAKRDLQRVNVLNSFPQLESALQSGSVSIAHVDVVARSFTQLDTEERRRITEQGEWLTNVAAHATPDNFGRAMKQTIARLATDNGLGRLEHQRRKTWLRHWVDRDSGMVCMRGEFDPESGLSLVGRLQQAVDRLFRERTPDTCPEGDAKVGHLNALGLVAIVCESDAHSAGNSIDTRGSVVNIHSATARAEVSVVIDYHTLTSGLHASSFVHTGTDVALPVETIRRMACDAKIIPVVLGSSGVVLDVGRSTRLATKHQRRAIEAMHSTCAIPECHVPVSQCQPHHIDYWNSGGNTDLNNLIPLCTAHHRCAHEGGWKLSLVPNTRKLMVRLPGQSPPTRPASVANVVS